MIPLPTTTTKAARNCGLRILPENDHLRQGEGNEQSPEQINRRNLPTEQAIEQHHSDHIGHWGGDKNRKCHLERHPCLDVTFSFPFIAAIYCLFGKTTKLILKKKNLASGPFLPYFLCARVLPVKFPNDFVTMMPHSNRFPR
jgi:hypothetical protein